jgi:hypothetical protein
MEEMIGAMTADLPPLGFDSLEMYRSMADAPIPEGTITGFE